MKAIILAAGFATRLYPITEKKAKPLLKIKNKPIVDYILEKIKEIKDINEIIIISNNKFYNDFLEWGKKKDVKIINDGVNSNEERLGSIGDLAFAIKKEKLNEDLLVISGDNLFNFSLEAPFKIFKKKKKDVVVLYDIKSLEDAKRFGVAIVKNSLLSDFEEKPSNPKSTLCSTGIYFYRKETIALINQFVKEEKNIDYPGLFLQHLYSRIPVYAYITEDKWFDIGAIKTLQDAEKLF